MKKRFIAIFAIVIVIAAAVVVGLMRKPSGPMINLSLDNERAASTTVVTGNAKIFADSSNQFAIDFYKNLKGTEAGNNIFISPYSISAAVAMAYEGANGTTADEIQKVFHFPSDKGSFKSSFAALYKALNPKDAKYILKTANSFWAQKDFSFLTSYLDTLKNYYSSSAFNVDFANAPEENRQIINKWVEDQTEKKIKDLFPEGTINAMTRMVLANAVYFKGKWTDPFDKKATENKNFTTDQNAIIQVPIMQKTENFLYAEDNKTQILTMPYEGDNLSMTILLPKDKKLNSLENSLSIDKLKGWKTNAQSQKVSVWLPKFNLTLSYNLGDNLAGMGMPSAFDSSAADFSGMTGKKDLFIGVIVHKAFIDVNEEGTEAAAATGIGMAQSLAPKPEKIIDFHADHPFLFFIQDNITGSILFMGRINNPSIK